MRGPAAPRRLHPNLARIAASYDDIVAAYARGEFDPEEARHRISSLVARDDHGIQWCISPNDGQWYRVTLSGALVADTPPEAGVATYAGWDLSGGGEPGDPRARVIDHAVDPRALADPEALSGSTARYVRNAATEAAPSRRRPLLLSAAIAVIVVVAVVAVVLLTRGGDSAPEQAPGTSVTSLTSTPN